MLRNCLLSCLFLLTSLNAFSTMQMRCVAIGAGGDVTINWFNTTSSVDFHAYYIYHSTSAAGPFALEDSILFYNTRTYNDATANANSQSAYYYVVLKSNTNPDEISDTIQAIKLSVLNIGNNGFATLNWNLNHTPPIVSNSPYYKIYRKYTAGGWILIDSVNVTVNAASYVEEITICSDTIKYRVEVADNSGCVSVSNVDGKYFEDVRPPQVPVVDSASMDALGNAVIGWHVNPSVDTKKYVVFQLIGANWVQVGDTLYGINSTFLSTTVNVSSTSQQFRVLAIDSCGNPSAMSLPHRTLLLNGSINKCTASYTLSWNSYINASFTNPFYQVIININGGQDSIVDVTTATSYSVTGLVADTNYCFRIRAILGGMATSTTNSICIVPDIPVAPVFSYIRKVTVSGKDVITVEAFVDTAADVLQYALKRSTSYNGTYSTVATISAGANPVISINDYVNTDRDYYYKVAAIDSCGYAVFFSQVSRSIFLKAEMNDDYTNSLSWNNYSQWNAGVSGYYIQKYTSANPDWQPLAMISYGDDSTYIDAVTNNYSSDGYFCYRIMAIENPGDMYGFTDTVYSNEACAQQKFTVFIPSGFRPGGRSGNFKPIFSFLSSEGYNLKIYNRFGGLIFESKNPGEGWDGTTSGRGAPMGIYHYHLEAKGGNGVDIKQSGSFTLLR
jgi:gliding motility-associated-like protein